MDIRTQGHFTGALSCSLLCAALPSSPILAPVGAVVACCMGAIAYDWGCKGLASGVTGEWRVLVDRYFPTAAKSTVLVALVAAAGLPNLLPLFSGWAFLSALLALSAMTGALLAKGNVHGISKPLEVSRQFYAWVQAAIGRFFGSAAA